MANPVQTTLLDDFNRTDDPTPPPGTNWTNSEFSANSTAGEGLAIVSNQLCRASSGGYRQGGYWNASSPGPDVDVVVEISGLPDTVDDGFSIYARLANIGDNATDGYGLVVENVDGTNYIFRIWRVDNSAATALQSSASNRAIASGDLLALQIVGSTIKGWWKAAAGSWDEVVSTTDANYSAAGRVGLEFVGNQSAKITNLWATTLVGQLLSPSADSVDGNWTDQAGGTSLAAAIDETTPSDSDYIRSELGPSASACRVKLAAGGDPQSSTGHIIHWRAGKDTTGGASIGMTVKLYQGGGNSIGGGTLIASFTRSNVDAFTTYDETLSSGQADSITNYGDLYLEFSANQT